MRRTFGITATATLVLTLMSPVEASHAPGHVARNSWDLYYTSTATDGLRVTSASFRSVRVLFALQVPQIKVYYPDWLAQPTTLVDQLGNGPASGGTSIPLVSIQQLNYTGYFELHATYQMAGWPALCTYKYRERYRFRDDGTWFLFVDVYGPGCDPDQADRSQYRVDQRYDFDLEGAAGDYWEWYSAAAKQFIRPSTEVSNQVYGGEDANGNAWRNFDAPRYSYMRRGTGEDPLIAVLLYPDNGSSSDNTGVIDPADADNDQAMQNADQVTWHSTRQWYTRASGCPPTCTAFAVLGPNMVLSGY